MTLDDDRPHFIRHLGPQWWNAGAAGDSIDLRDLSAMRVGPVRATARILRAHEGLAQLWVELHDLGTGHLMTHVVADAIPLETFRVR